MHRPLTLTCFVLAIAAGASAASADVTWINPSGGLFHTPGNWDSPAAPGPSDRVIFNLGNTYTVSFNTPAINERLRVRNGQVTFNLTNGAYELTLSPAVSAQIGLLSNDNARLTVSGGGVTTKETVLGQFGGSNGELVVTGSAASWHCSTAIHVGAAGTGVLRILNGAIVSSIGTVIVGRESGSDGLIEIGSSNSRFLTNGTLSIGPSTFDFLSERNGVDRGGDGDTRGFFNSEGKVMLTPGGRIAASNITIGPNGSLIGAGVIQTNSLSNDGGFIRAIIGLPLRIEGQYSDTPGARIEFEVGGATAAFSHALLVVTQQASPQGTVVVKLVNGFVPSAGDSFTIMTSAGFNSQFGAFDLPSLSGNLEWVVDYSTNSLTLHVVEPVTEIPADLNGDGVVNAHDLGILLGSWGVCPDPPAECPADINGDGLVNAQDLGILLGSWGQTSN